MKKVHIEPLPKSRHGILSFIDRAAFQPNVLEVALRPDGIHVTREVAYEEDQVIPSGTHDVDIPFVLQNIELVSVPFDPTQIAMYTLHAAVTEISRRGHEVYAIVVPGIELFEAWMGIPAITGKNKKFFGIPFISAKPIDTNNRVVVLGTPPNSIFLSSAVIGVAVDLGV